MLTLWFFPQRFNAEEQLRIIKDNNIKMHNINLKVRCGFFFLPLMPFKVLLSNRCQHLSTLILKVSV